MALNKLPSETMAHLTSTLVTPGHVDREAFMSQAELLPLMARVDIAHQALLDARESAVALALAPIGESQLEFDHQHDWFARGLESGLMMYIALAKARREDELAARLENLHHLLFPDGLDVVNLSYREEAGHGQFLRSKLTSEVARQLESMAITDGSLLDIVNDWIDAAAELGVLENQRVALKTRGQGGAMARARALWGRIIRLVRQTVVDLEITNATVLEVMDRIARAERAAELRALREARGEEPEEEPEEEPGEEPEEEPEEEPGEEPGEGQPMAADPVEADAMDEGRPVEAIES